MIIVYEDGFESYNNGDDLTVAGWMKYGDPAVVSNVAPIMGSKSLYIANGMDIYYEWTSPLVATSYSCEFKLRPENTDGQGYFYVSFTNGGLFSNEDVNFAFDLFGAGGEMRMQYNDGIGGITMQVPIIPSISWPNNYTLVKVEVTPYSNQVFVNGALVYGAPHSGAEGQIIGMALFTNPSGSTTRLKMDDFVFRAVGAKAPQNVFAIRRANYTVVAWDRVTQYENGMPLTNVSAYNVYKSTKINEFDRALKKQVVTVNPDGINDTIMLDTDGNEVSVYRVTAVVGDPSLVLESQLSDKTVALKSASLIDGKEELVDRKIGRFGKGKFGEAIFA